MRLLDLFCGAGGAAMGYYQAGFTDIVGVDIEPQPNYPFNMYVADAIDFGTTMDLSGFDLIHASPPCQEHVHMGKLRGGGKFNPRWPDMIAPTRGLIEGHKYVIENVQGAKKALQSPMLLTGEMFGLSTTRARFFELGGWFVMSPPKMRRMRDPVAIYGPADGRWLNRRVDGQKQHAWSSIEEGKEALQVPWMTDELEVREAIPPAYTKFIGEQFLAQVSA